MLTCALLLVPGTAFGLPPGAQGAAGGAVRIEAERPAAREPANGSFAVPHDTRWASGRTCLVRFHGKGRCTWELRLDEPGRRVVWLRYAAANATTVAVGVDPAPGDELRRAALPPTGGLGGPDAWGWAPLLEIELAAGLHALVLEAAPIRPDCFLVLPPGTRPEEAESPDPPPLAAEERERLARPLHPLRPSWLAGADAYRLPAWFDGNRVSVHTRLPRRLRDEPVFTSAARAFRSLGAEVYVRHVKTLGEGAWWPSASGAVEPWVGEDDPVAAMVARAHEAGMRLIAYHRHSEDDHLAEEHPDWICRDEQGRAIRRRGHPRLCLASPYADFVQGRLLELAARGVDGLYFDESHAPPEGCLCGFSRAGFAAETGLDAPGPAPGDPRRARLVEYQNGVVERAFARWRAALHAKHPDLVLVVGSHLVPDLLGPHLGTRLLALSDSVKTEFGKGRSARVLAFLREHADLRPPARDAHVALGWALCRDGADGRPPHVWIHGLTDARAARAATAAVVAHGGVANLDHPEATIPDAETFGSAVSLGRRASRALAGTRPLRTSLLHVPENARERLAADDLARWKALLAPLHGAWETHLRAGLPATLVTDHQLAAGLPAECRTLFLPAPRSLTREQEASVAAFRARGGAVVAGRPEWAWHRRGAAGDEARTAYLAELAPLAGDAPVRVTGAEGTHAAAFLSADGERLVVTLTNDFAWLLAGGREALAPRPGAAPPPCRGARVVLRPPLVPRACRDVLGGEPLELEAVDGGVVVEVPAFDELAVLELEL